MQHKKTYAIVSDYAETGENKHDLLLDELTNALTNSANQRTAYWRLSRTGGIGQSRQLAIARVNSYDCMEILPS